METTKLEHVDRHSVENAKAGEKHLSCSGLRFGTIKRSKMHQQHESLAGRVSSIETTVSSPPTERRGQAIKSLHAGKSRKTEKPITGAERKSMFLKATLCPNTRQTATKRSTEHHRRQKGDLRCPVLLYSLSSFKNLILLFNSLIMENNGVSG